MIVVWLFLVVPWVYLQFVIVVFPDHTQLLFFYYRDDLRHVTRKLTESISTYKNDIFLFRYNVLALHTQKLCAYMGRLSTRLASGLSSVQAQNHKITCLLHQHAFALDVL